MVNIRHAPYSLHSLRLNPHFPAPFGGQEAFVLPSVPCHGCYNNLLGRRELTAIIARRISAATCGTMAFPRALILSTPLGIP